MHTQSIQRVGAELVQRIQDGAGRITDESRSPARRGARQYSRGFQHYLRTIRPTQIDNPLYVGRLSFRVVIGLSNIELVGQGVVRI